MTDHGIATVGAGGLAELEGKVSGREDLVGRREAAGWIRYDTQADGTYRFTRPEHPGHPFAAYCGVTDSGGLEVRGWRAGDVKEASSLHERFTLAARESGTCSVDVP